MGKRRNAVEFFAEEPIDGKAPWFFTVRYQRRPCFTRIGCQKHFLEFAAIVAREAERVREELERG